VLASLCARRGIGGRHRLVAGNELSCNGIFTVDLEDRTPSPYTYTMCVGATLMIDTRATAMCAMHATPCFPSHWAVACRPNQAWQTRSSLPRVAPL
jgi:hypothetical protein